MNILDWFRFFRNSQHLSGKSYRLTPFSQLAAGALLLVVANAAWSKGEVEGILTESKPATPSSYIKDGIQLNWGQGNDIFLKGFVYQGKTYSKLTRPDNIVINRVDNDNVKGIRCTMYAENTGNPYILEPSYPDDGTGNCDMAELVSGNVINRGTLDAFANSQADESSHNNIERIDFIFSAGIEGSEDPELLKTSGHLVAEKSGNNFVKVAAITALDQGKPSGYGPLVLISPSTANPDQLRYGILPGTIRDFSFLSSEAIPPQTQPAFHDTSREALGMAFVSLDTLGIAPGQTYYGFSFFAPDVNKSEHTLTDPDTFPHDTRRFPDGDADLFGGTGFFAQPKKPEPENKAPVANDDTGSTRQGEPVAVDVLANDSDPESDPLTFEIVVQPEHGTLDIEGDIVTYTPDDGYSGKDSFSYEVSDGRGGKDTASVLISITAVKDDPIVERPAVDLGRIETGLNGHGAGGMDGVLLLLLSFAVTWRFRRSFSKEASNLR